MAADATIDAFEQGVRGPSVIGVLVPPCQLVSAISATRDAGSGCLAGAPSIASVIRRQAPIWAGFPDRSIA